MNLSIEHIVPIYDIAIHGLVSTLVCLNHCSVQAHACKDTVAAGIRQDLGIQLEIYCRCGLPADWTRGYTCIRSSLNLSLSRLCRAWVFMKSITMSVEEPPI